MNLIGNIPLPVLITYLKWLQKRNKLCSFHDHIVEVEALILQEGVYR